MESLAIAGSPSRVSIWLKHPCAMIALNRKSAKNWWSYSAAGFVARSSGAGIMPESVSVTKITDSTIRARKGSGRNP